MPKNASSDIKKALAQVIQLVDNADLTKLGGKTMKSVTLSHMELNHAKLFQKPLDKLIWN